MQIGQLSVETGVPTKTIRYYEEIGVLPAPPRSPNGYRDFTDEAVERLRFIKDSQSTGLTLNEIATILEMRDQGESTCDHVAALLESHLEQIERQLETLIRTRDHLRRATAQAKSVDPRKCINPNRCQTIGTRAQH
jgi:MerR family transcriptional regulator, copper efflux regulator